MILYQFAQDVAERDMTFLNPRRDRRWDDKGMIDYRRGVLTIRNATRLRRAACECVDAMLRASNGSGHRQA